MGGDEEPQAPANADAASTSSFAQQHEASTSTELEHYSFKSRVHRGAKYANSCSTCGKSFKKPSDLIRHVRIHTGERPYRCDQCSRDFTVKSTLDSHRKTHGPRMSCTLLCLADLGGSPGAHIG